MKTFSAVEHLYFLNTNCFPFILLSICEKQLVESVILACALLLYSMYFRCFCDILAYRGCGMRFAD